MTLAWTFHCLWMTSQVLFVCPSNSLAKGLCARSASFPGNSDRHKHARSLRILLQELSDLIIFDSVTCVVFQLLQTHWQLPAEPINVIMLINVEALATISEQKPLVGHFLETECSTQYGPWPPTTLLQAPFPQDSFRPTPPSEACPLSTQVPNTHDAHLLTSASSPLASHVSVWSPFQFSYSSNPSLLSWPTPSPGTSSRSLAICCCRCQPKLSS